MTKNRLNEEEILVERFFSEQRPRPIEDDGFSRRVMQRLPVENSRLDRLAAAWQILCGTLCVVLVLCSGVLQRLGRQAHDLCGQVLEWGASHLSPASWPPPSSWSLPTLSLADIGQAMPHLQWGIEPLVTLIALMCILTLLTVNLIKNYN